MVIVCTHPRTSRLDGKRLTNSPSSLYNVMYSVQTIRFACLFYAFNWMQSSSVSECTEEDTETKKEEEEKKKKKKTITLTHIRERTVYRCYCCSVDTLRCELIACISFWHWVLSWSSYSILSLSVYRSFHSGVIVGLLIAKMLLFCAHRLTKLQTIEQ